MPSVTIPAQLAPTEKALPISRSEKRLNQNPLQENLQNVFKPVRMSEGVQEPTSHEWQGAMVDGTRTAIVGLLKPTAAWKYHARYDLR